MKRTRKVTQQSNRHQPDIVFGRSRDEIEASIGIDNDHLYRVISETDYQRIITQGVLNTDGRGNISMSEGTVADRGRPAWAYLGDIARKGKDDNPTGQGRLIKIRLEESDGWKQDSDGYWKTNNDVPSDRIVAASMPIGIRRIATDSNGSFRTVYDFSDRPVDLGVSVPEMPEYNGEREVTQDHLRWANPKHREWKKKAEEAYGSIVRGEPISADDEMVPDFVYHVTPALGGITADGKIVAGGMGGLGGDDRDRIVSMTTSRQVADDIVADMRLLRDVAAMDLSGDDLISYLRRMAEKESTSRRSLDDEASVKEAFTFRGAGYSAEAVEVDRYGSEIEVGVRLVSDAGDEIGRARRIVYPGIDGQPARVKHVSMKLNENQRGQGIGADYLERSVGMYKARGVGTVMINATSSPGTANGAYIWAKLGFEMSPSARGALTRRMGELPDVPADLAKRFGESSMSIADLAADPVGKRFLSGEFGAVSWDGVMRIGGDVTASATSEKIADHKWDSIAREAENNGTAAAISAYLWTRDLAGGRRNPLFVGLSGLLKKWTEKPPSKADIGIIKIPRKNLKTGAQLTNFDVGDGFLEEIRLYGDVPVSGATVIPVEGEEQSYRIGNLTKRRVAD